MKKKLLVLCLVLALCLSLFVACAHQHMFEEDWTYDNTHHWHAANCGHDEEVDGKATHDLQPVPGSGVMQCTVCGYTSLGGHTHTFSEKWSFDNDNHWHEATCAHKNEVSAKAPHTFVNGACSTCGLWESVTDMVMSALANSDIWSYTLNFSELVVDIDDESYMVFRDVELGLKFDSNKKLAAFGSFDHAVCNYIRLAGGDIIDEEVTNGQFVVKNDTLYLKAYADDYARALRCPMETLMDTIAQNMESEIPVEEVLAQIEASKASIQAAYNQIKELAGALGGELDGLLDQLFVATKVGAETVYTPDYEIISVLNKVLATKLIPSYVDDAFGKGTFENLPTIAEQLFKLKIGDIIDKLEAQGYTMQELIAMVDSVIAQNYPDDKVNSLEELLQAQGILDETMTIDGVISMAKEMTLGALWNSTVGAGANGMKASDFVKTLGEYCVMMKEMTVYDLISGITRIDSDVIEALVDEAVYMLQDYLTLELHVKSGVLQSVVFGADSFDNDPYVRDLTEAQEAALEVLTPVRESLKKVNGKISLTRNYVSTVDYDKVISEVNKTVDLTVNLSKADVKKYISDEFGSDAVATQANGVITVNYNEVRPNTYVYDYDGDYGVIFTAKATLKIDTKNGFAPVTVGCNGIRYFEFRTYPVYQDMKAQYFKINAGTGGPQIITETEFFNAVSAYNKYSVNEIKREIEEFSFSDYRYVDFCVDADGKLTNEDSYRHYWVMDEEKSDVDVECGQTCTMVYHCENCQRDDTDYMKKTHEFNYDDRKYEEIVEGDPKEGYREYTKCQLCGEYVLTSEYVTYAPNPDITLDPDYFD